MTLWRAVGAAGLLLCLNQAQAGNGLNMIAFGTESETMGGADIALSRDTAALTLNPAGLTQIERARLDVFVSPYYQIDNRHSDALGNDASVSRRPGFTGGAGYARRLSPQVVAGVGLYVQGGVGFIYEDFETGYGGRDDASSLFGIFKLAPGIAFQASENTSVGISAALLYAVARQKLFPDTSSFSADNPADVFFGNRLDGLTASGIGMRAGVLHRVSDTLTVAAALSTRTPLDFDGGTMTLDYSAIGQGKVRYGDARMEGLSVAQDLTLGLAYRPHPDWLVAVDLGWLEWSRALERIRIEASAPDGVVDPALVPQALSAESPVRLRDQYVIAIGVEYRWSDQTVLRAGYNYGRSPIAAEYLTPLLAVAVENHLTFGVSHRMGPHWELGAGLQYQPHSKARSRNPNLRVAEDGQEENHVIYMPIMLTRHW